MPVPKSKVIANKKYRAKAYDTIGFDVPKGKREEFKAIAAERGLSLARFLLLAAESYAGLQSVESFKPASMTKEPTAEKLTSAERTLLDEFNRLPVDVQKAFLKTFKAINAAQDADNQSASLQ